MLVQGSPIELVSVRESLGPCTLPHGDQPVLFRVQHSALLPHWLWVGDGGRKEPIILNSAIEASPLVVTVAGGVNKKGQFKTPECSMQARAATDLV